MDNQTVQLFLPLIAMVAVSYFFLIRPQKKREEDNRRMRESLVVGDKIVTIGGIKGTILYIGDDDIIISGADENTKLLMTKSSILSKIDDHVSLEGEELDEE